MKNMILTPAELVAVIESGHLDRLEADALHAAVSKAAHPHLPYCDHHESGKEAGEDDYCHSAPVYYGGDDETQSGDQRMPSWAVQVYAGHQDTRQTVIVFTKADLLFLELRDAKLLREALDHDSPGLLTALEAVIAQCEEVPA